MTMDEELVQNMSQMTNDAAMSVWDRSMIPEGHAGAVTYAMWGVEDEAAGAYKETVRETSAAFGCDERDYYRANPDAAVAFAPEYLRDQRQREMIEWAKAERERELAADLSPFGDENDAALVVSDTSEVHSSLRS